MTNLSQDQWLPLACAIALATLLTLSAGRFDQRFGEPGTVASSFNPAIFVAVLIASCLGGLERGSFAERLSLVALGGTLCTAAIVDLRHLVLPDLLLAPLLVLGLVRASTEGGVGLTDAVIGFAVGAGSLLAIALLYRYWRGVEGLGFGDVKLVGVAGAWVGWERLPDLLLIASVSTIAAIVLVGVLSTKTGASRPWPFGPGLALALYGIAIGLPPIAEAAWP